MKKDNQLVIFEDKDKKIQIQLKEQTLWLDAHQIAYLFDVQRPAIVKHIRNIYKSGELDEKATCSILEQVAAEGKIRKMNLYNLDVIIAVGYRVNSKKAARFITDLCINPVTASPAGQKDQLIKLIMNFIALEN